MFIEKWETIISDKKSFDNSNSDKVIENSSQNRNQDSSVAYGNDFTRNNNVNDAEECSNMQLQDVRAQRQSKYVNYQNEEIKARGTRNMSIITDATREPEIISKESPKESKDGDNPKEWPKGTVCVVGDSILNGMDEKLFSWKRIAKGRPFSGAMVSDMYDLLKPALKRNPDYIILHNRYKRCFKEYSK